MEPVIRIQIAHHNRLLRECLATAITAEMGLRANALTHEDPRLLEQIESQQADIILVDLALPDGFAARLTRHVGEKLPSTKVIVFAREPLDQQVAECVAAGAAGCLLEASSLEGLCEAVRRVHGGGTYCSLEIMNAALQLLGSTAGKRPGRHDAHDPTLTPREHEVVDLIGRGLSNKQIAKRLALSLYTVKNHVHNIIEKLHVRNRTEAVQYVQQHRWRTLESHPVGRSRCAQ